GGADDLDGGGAVLAHRAVHELDAEQVDDRVRDLRGGDLAPQLVRRYRVREALPQDGREVVAQVMGELRVVGQVGLEQPTVEAHLHVGEHHGQLGARE